MLFDDSVTLYVVSMMDEWVWSIAGIRLTGESRITRKERCHIVTSTTTWPGLNEGLRGEMPATNRLSHDRPIVCYSYSQKRGFGRLFCVGEVLCYSSNGRRFLEQFISNHALENVQLNIQE
jgi:hypothetical protein